MAAILYARAFTAEQITEHRLVHASAAGSVDQVGADQNGALAV
jgi:hypothetical protein